MATIVACLAVTTNFISCGDNSSDASELSPPKWLHGEWGNYNFTSDDICYTIPKMDGSLGIYCYRETYVDSDMPVKETVKTNEIYEVSIGQKNQVLNVTKGDGTYVVYKLSQNGLLVESGNLPKK
jgi:hypothetical protein